MTRTSTSFTEGNLVAVKHGARSVQLWKSSRRGHTSRVRRELDAGMPEAVKTWLVRLIGPIQWRVDRYNAWLESKGGPVTPRYGRPLPCVEMLQRDESRLLNVYSLLLRGELFDRDGEDPLAQFFREGARS